MPRGRKALQPIDPPSGQLQEAMALNELLAQRRRELEETTHKLTLVHAQIQSARQKWEREQVVTSQEWKHQVHADREALEIERTEVARLHRAAQDLYDRMMLQNEDSRLRMSSLNEREAAMAGLNQARIETATLRREAERKMEDATQTLQTGQRLQQESEERMREVMATVTECERRNQAMNAEWNKLHAWQESLDLREKDAKIVQQELDKKLETLGALTEMKPKEEVVHAES